MVEEDASERWSEDDRGLRYVSLENIDVTNVSSSFSKSNRVGDKKREKRK